MSSKQFFFAIVYSSFFPLSFYLAPNIFDFSLLITLPFLKLAWIAKNYAMEIYPHGYYAMLAATFAIFIQVLLVIFIINILQKIFKRTRLLKTKKSHY